MLTRRMGHDAVLHSLRRALASDLKSVKMNVVVVKGLNDMEILDFVEMTRDRNLSIRFIEFMPFTGNKWDKSKMVPSAEILSCISKNHPNLAKVTDELNDTARSYHIPGYQGSIGFISSMSDHFCGSCNRLRLTADGQIKVCLFDAKEVSLRDQMRVGADDSQLLQVIGRAVRGKKEKHAGIYIASHSNLTRISPLARSPRHHGSWFPTAPFSSSQPCSFAQLRFATTKSGFERSRHAELPKLTHIDAEGRPCMVDVSNKRPTSRTATAVGRIHLPRVAYELVTHAPVPTSVPGAGFESEDDINTSVLSNSDSAVSDLEEKRDLEKAKAKARRKGDVMAVAQLAAIMACKRTAELIPLCHPLPLTHVSVVLTPETEPVRRFAASTSAFAGTPQTNGGPQEGDERQHPYSIKCVATVSCEGKTGVEMEALTAVSVGLLTVWDMLKAVAGKDMVIGEIYVNAKTGGNSGDFVRGNRNGV
ncbi:hypothetical protein EW146_g299 [Bondarzewia mesenterica]|uniref:cyclic pyranopterin monophosphate synthase n=1 Tax=Bondarzewia mesenterica TaxID=1095465 RepID=A0A4S4M9A2_9AGAM|nr:hypothetical protein EW146_g299 [Bondarzewia mesenterica]